MKDQTLRKEYTDCQAEVTAEDIARGLECGNPGCTCAREGETGWVTHCPNHDDERPSLSLTEAEDGKILVYCHAGCDQMDVIQALADRDLWPSKPGTSQRTRTYSAQPPKGELLEAYSYLDEDGQLLYQVCRFAPKAFRLRRLVGPGEWEYSIKGSRLVPYHLPDVLKAESVFVVEGEKDCNNLKNLGLTASCNPMGAGKWPREFNVYFQDKQIVILPDNDEPGRKHAESVARQLHDVAASVRILELPGLREKGDVSDWLAAGGTAAMLQGLAEAAPQWQTSGRTPRQKTKPKSQGGPRQEGPGLRVVAPDEVVEATLVKDVLPEAPVPDNLIVPARWNLSPVGVGELIRRQDGIELVPIAPTPIVLAGRLINQIDGTEKTRLAFFRDGVWKQHIAERTVIATTRSITQMAGVGLPVTSNNARHLVEFLAEFEAANLEFLPRIRVSPHLGWQRTGDELGFLWGRTFLSPGRQPLLIDLEGPCQAWHPNLVTFQGADAGEEQLADAFHSRGSFEVWMRAMERVAQFPRVILGAYASLAPPLLVILECPNFILDWSGPTSYGKSTTVRAGGSCWANPDERAAASVVGTWDATRVWINSASTLLHSLPLILDDTKRCKNPKDIARVCYDVASGRDRGRGSKMGLRRTGTWRTILLSTGEAPATSFTTDGGTRGRVLTLWGPPFGRADQTMAPVVQELNSAVLRNYGHAGPLFIQFLLDHQSDWERWRVKYHEVLEAYQAKAGADPVAGRLCQYFAVLDLTAGLAHAALELPWSYRDPVEELWDDLVAGAAEGDVALQALVMVVGWAKANQSSFQGREYRGQVPLHGWAGKWEAHTSWEYIAFLPHRLTELLQGFNFEPEAVIRAWQDRGWLIGGAGRKKKQVRLDGEPVYTWALSRAAVEEIDGQ
jgi:putative DNA primase/helicase